MRLYLRSALRIELTYLTNIEVNFLYMTRPPLYTVGGALSRHSVRRVGRMQFDPSLSSVSIVLDPVARHTVPAATCLQAVAIGRGDGLRQAVKAPVVVVSHPEGVVHPVGDRQRAAVLVRVAGDGDARHKAGATDHADPLRAKQAWTAAECTLHDLLQELVV